MKNLFGFILLFLFFKTDAQYYYKDLMAADDMKQQMKLLIDNKIQKIISTGYTPNGATTADYDETQEVDAVKKQIRITTILKHTVTRIHYTFDNKGRLQSISDISMGLKSISEYTYDNAGNITIIKNVITDSLQDFTQTEIHTWIYKNNKPEKMWRTINNTDSLEVKFKTDEQGNVIEEQNFKKGKASDPTYYYYDNKNRLTDIVRYNIMAKRLLPDYLFEYDDANRVIQKITTISSQNRGYLTWRYLYNEMGLKTKEALFNKEKQLQGRIDYSYINY